MTAAAVAEVDGGAVIDADRVRGGLVGFLVGGCGAGGLSAGRVGRAGQAFDVQRGAGEQQLDVEQARAATAGPVQTVLVLEFGDTTFASAIRRVYAQIPCGVLQRCLAAWAACWASVLGTPSAASIVRCGGTNAVMPNSATPFQTRSAAKP